jgi:hypothetical protein
MRGGGGSRSSRDCARLGLACAGPSLAWVQLRFRSVRGRAPPRHRHRSRDGNTCDRAFERDGHVRGDGPDGRQDARDRDSRRVLGDAAPPRLAERRAQCRSVGGRRRRDRGPERSGGAGRALRLPRHPPIGRAAGLPRSSALPAVPAGVRPARGVTLPARAGARGDATGSGSRARSGSARPARPACGSPTGSAGNGARRGDSRARHAWSATGGLGSCAADRGRNAGGSEGQGSRTGGCGRPDRCRRPPKRAAGERSHARCHRLRPGGGRTHARESEWRLRAGQATARPRSAGAPAASWARRAARRHHSCGGPEQRLSVPGGRRSPSRGCVCRLRAGLA